MKHTQRERLAHNNTFVQQADAMSVIFVYFTLGLVLTLYSLCVLCLSIRLKYASNKARTFLTYYIKYLSAKVTFRSHLSMDRYSDEIKEKRKNKNNDTFHSLNWKLNSGKFLSPFDATFFCFCFYMTFSMNHIV